MPTEGVYYIGDDIVMSVSDKHYIGTDLKFAFTVAAEGFDMSSDEYEVKLVCGNKRVDVPKTDIVPGDDEGEYLLLVDSTKFPSGVLRMVVTATVTDSDFPDLKRQEVGALDLCVLKHAY